MLYVVMQDNEGSVTAVDTKTMKATAHYPLGDKGGCNGLALDAKIRCLFAACARSGNPLDRAEADDGGAEREGWQGAGEPAAGRRIGWRGVQPGDRWKRSARMATAR